MLICCRPPCQYTRAHAISIPPIHRHLRSQADEPRSDLTPREVVDRLDRNIVGQVGTAGMH